MMTRVGWIRILGLLCAGLCAAPMTGAQNPPNRKSGANAGTVSRQPSQSAQRPAPAASTPRTAQTNIQKQPVAAQPQPAAGALKPSTKVYTQPVTNVRPNVSTTTVPVQTSVPTKTQPAQTTPGMYTHPITSGQPSGSTAAPAQSVPAGTPSLFINKPVQGVQPKVTPTQSIPAQTLPTGQTSTPGTTGATGTSDGPAANTNGSPYNTKYNPKTSDGNTKGSGTSDGLPSSDANSNGSQSTGTKPAPAPTPPPSDAHKVPPSHLPPKRPHSPVQIFVSPAIPLGRVFPPRGDEPRPPSRVTSVTPPADPSPVSSPTPTPAPSPASPAQASDNGQQPQAPPANTPTPNVATPATPQPNGRTQRPGAEPPKATPVVVELLPLDPIQPSIQPSILPSALTLTTTTDQPMVGKDVVVVAALEPSRPGTSYRLNWGDGSVETVTGSGRGTHRYAKAKPYTVSASTVVGDRELNHEVLLQVGSVGPFWPRYDWLLAALAGLAALALHFPSVPVPKLTASPRWGAPGVPEMTLLNREPYLSLSFEPGVRPAEEDITFSKKRRKSGLEQG
jgi:hypothetical protein